jgi:hypothetical protein
MIARTRSVAGLAIHAFTLILAVGVTSPAAGQAPSRDTAAAGHSAVKDLPLSAAQRLAYVGRYRVRMPSGEQGGLVISEVNGELHAQPEGEPKPLRILYQGDGDFRPEGVPDFVFHFVLEDGRATKFTVKKEDGLMTGVRIE